MRILSIDVGIKNLAYCLVDVDNDENFKIIQWDILNLCSQDYENGNNFICSVNVKKNKVLSPCTKKVTHVCMKDLNHTYICSHHLKKMFPNLLTIKQVKSSSIQELQQIAKEYNIVSEINDKKNITNSIIQYIKNNLYHEIIKVSSNHIDLISVGISIRNSFNKEFQVDTIDKIIIENQISTLATRMKSIQGMIAQYFIMNNKTDIHFISSSNKLKFFFKTKKTDYKERKKKSIEITTKILEMYNSNMLSIFNNNKKKDDLSDSFLQCIWYLLHNKLIKEIHL